MVKNYKYAELYRYFKKLDGNFIKLSYEEIENIIGFKLPVSAYKYNAYWQPSETHTITRSWIENNWKTVHVALGKYVEFERVIRDVLKSEVEYKIEVYLSKDIINKLVSEVTKIGACKVGDYDHIASYYEIEGCWRPLEESSPFSGKKNIINNGTEYKLELRCNDQCITEVLKKIVEIHPYEKPLINVIKLENHMIDFI